MSKASVCPPQDLAGLARPGYPQGTASQTHGLAKATPAPLTAAPHCGLPHPSAWEPFSPRNPVRVHGGSREARPAWWEG